MKIEMMLTIFLTSLMGIVCAKTMLMNPLQKPFCYSNPADHKEVLSGTWFNSTNRVAKYWNLSCPMEVSKQACSHFGPSHQEHAEYAARLQFLPSNCHLLSLDELIPYFAAMKKTIIFVGNSLSRELILGMACNAYSMGLVTGFDLKWLPCDTNHNYPCHGALNCVECGPYSGFDHDGAKVFFKGGTVIEMVESYSTEHVEFAERNTTVDVVVVQQWHLEETGLIKFANHLLAQKKPLPHLIWWPGFNAHFANGGGLLQGKYNETELARLKSEQGIVGCLQTVGPPGYRNDKDLFKIWPPSGFFGVEGINNFGDAKVGNVVGKFGDCQHFCSPGPADMLAIPLMQMILSLAGGDKFTVED
jgi:hypothetical protein